MKKRLARKGIELDDDACMYSTRHTYAKRTSAADTGPRKLTNIETLAELMGDTPSNLPRPLCQSGAKTYSEPLWQSA